MRERPIKNTRATRRALAVYPSTGGENLGDLIAAIDTLRQHLGYSRWSGLRAWCDADDPLTADRWGLECLEERLCIKWVENGGGVVNG